MPTRIARSGLLAVAASVALAGCAVGPELREAQASDAASNTGSSKRPRRRNRWPMPPGFRCSTIRPCRRSSGTPSPTTSTCASPWRTSKRRVPVPGSPSRTSTRRSMAPPPTACGGRRRTEENNDTTHQSGVYGFQLSWEIDLFGRLRRGQEAAMALALASEQGRRGVLVTLVGDVATNYFLLRELDLQLEIARETLRLNDETVTYFQNRLDGGVSNRLELDRIQALRAQTAAAIPEIERQIALVENLISLLLGRPPGPITRQSADQRRTAAAADSAGPSRVAARAPARRRPGRTGARGGQRRHRRGEIAVLSHDQPDRLSRRRQRRSHLVPRRERGRVVAEPGPLSADLPGRAHSPESRGGPGAIRRGAGRIPEGGAQQLPRGRQLAGHDSEAGRAARPPARQASPPCRTRPIWPASGTTPASRATSRS